jgi:CheY-like chemotaxis protein
VGEASRPSILLVDDEPRVLSALQRGLRREAVEVETAGSAEEALALLESRSFALVISDHKMPGMTGVELLTRVRRAWPATERILLSGWSSEIEPEEIDGAGLFALLSKPWDDAEMRDAIRRAVGLT